MSINKAISKLIQKQTLTEEESRAAINQIMRGEATESQIGAFLMGLRIKGESAEEILGAVKALRDNMVALDTDEESLIDTCGTGGDGGKTFNISTAVAIVAASGGVKVAKHGNKAVSSKSGSADVLNELGIKTDFSVEESKRNIKEKGMAFLFAPNYHKAMKNVASVRKELGVRTIFNIIGPLANPAPIKGQLLGIYDSDLAESVGSVLFQLGLERALVVHGDDGLDEITTTTTTTVCEVSKEGTVVYKISPEQYGIHKAYLEDIKGGEPKENAEIILNILKGVKGAKRDIVVLNSAAALYVGKKVDSIEEGVKMAEELIDLGLAYEKYQQLKEDLSGVNQG